jgi:hypothetical protein
MTMAVNPGPASGEDYYTLLGVRADGVASVVDLLPAEGDTALSARAMKLLAEHASCDCVEAWRGAVLVERFSR